MAVVMEYTRPGGTIIRINNDSYKNKTPEEMQAACDKVNKVASMLIYKTMPLQTNKGR